MQWRGQSVRVAGCCLRTVRDGVIWVLTTLGRASRSGFTVMHVSVRRKRGSAATPHGGFSAVPGSRTGLVGPSEVPCLVASRVPADGEERLNCHRRRDVATCRQDAWLALPELSDASYQRSTRSALKVFHRLGVPSGSSNRKWTSPE